jgi:hypothetical protein
MAPKKTEEKKERPILGRFRSNLKVGRKTSVAADPSHCGCMEMTVLDERAPGGRASGSVPPLGVQRARPTRARRSAQEPA